MIDTTPELFELPKRRDRATRLLSFISETVVNGKTAIPNSRASLPHVPPLKNMSRIPDGYRDRFLQQGAAEFLR